MAIRDHTREDIREDVVTDSTQVRDPISMAKVFAFLLGALNVIVGAVGLARTGFDAPTEETTVVFGLSMTALLALSHLILGALALAGATSSSVAKSTLSAAGAILVIAGVVAIVQPIEALGWTDTNGFVYLVFGVAALLAGMLSTEGTIYRSSRIEEGTTRTHV